MSERRSSYAPTKELRSSNPHTKHKAFRYAIIGAGSAAYSAVRAIRETDKDGEILLVGDTVHKTLPFHKPPLSDELSNTNKININYVPVLDFTDVGVGEGDNEADVEKASREEGKGERRDSVSQINDPKLIHIKHQQAKRLDSKEQTLTLEDGTIFEYDSCLIATGGSPLTPPALASLPSNTTMTYRTIKDFHKLKEVCKKVKKVCVIGAGLLASELAYSVAQTGIQVIQLFNGPGIYSKLLPKYLSDNVTEKSHEHGVEVKSGTVVSTKKNTDNSITLVLDNGDQIDTEFAVVCAGTQPNVEIAQSAGLPISKEDGGVVVESTLEVCPDIYAAGDIISWKDPIFKRHRRVDHHDHALKSGYIAGKNMCGNILEYHHQPFFWSDLGFIAFEAVGLIDAHLETVGIWKDGEDIHILGGDSVSNKNLQFKTGFVYYLQDGFIVGIVLVGMFGHLEQARAMIIQRRIQIEKPENCRNLISFAQQ